MCLILFASAAHPRYPLIVAANRDEAYARPSASAAFWDDHPHVYGGRDLERGGTWLAISRTGRFAAITNYRQGVGRRDAEHSRGELTRDYLTGNESPADYLRRADARSGGYNGYSLIVGTPGELWFHSNRGAAAQPVPAGVHGLSNRLLDEPWPKVLRGVAELTSLLDAGEDALSSRLMGLLADRASAPDHLLPSTGIALERERALSASFIQGDTYGTRASTVVLVAADGETLFRERTYGPAGALLGETTERFGIQTLSRAPAPPRARA